MKLEEKIESLEVRLAQLFQRIDILEQDNAALKKENTILKAENAILKRENTILKAENLSLKQKLNLNSGNSSKPPSSDFIKQPGIPRKKGGPRGGKEGHEGNTLKMVETADKQEVHYSENCSHCGDHLEKETYRLGAESRQVWDIEKISFTITEHRIAVQKCTKCGILNSGKFPQYATQPTQYGPNIKGLCVYMNNECNIPYEKISQLTEDLFGQRINNASILNMQTACAQKLSPVMAHIKQQVINSAVVHLDETGARTEGKNYWVHTASTPKYTYMFSHRNRGHKATDSEDSILKDFTGTGVTDFLPAYEKYSMTHSYCNAHLLRDLRSASETGAAWANEMSDFLLSTKAAAEAQGGALTEADYIKCEKQYDEIVKKAAEANDTVKKTKALIKRLSKHKSGILGFAKNQEVPFTNNLAERDIRPVKTKLKVATSFRSEKGLKAFTEIRSFISTIKKHSMNAQSALIALMGGSFSVASFQQAK